nr:hypothetical protein CFP56_73919 [Quercus suber]
MSAKCWEIFSSTIMIHDGGVVAAELSKVVAGAPQLITIGTDKKLTIWDTISFKVSSSVIGRRFYNQNFPMDCLF